MKPDYTVLDNAAREAGCEVLENEPMSRRTTFRIGGPADRLYRIGTSDQLQKLLPLLEREKIPFLVVGNGSNLLVSDKGIRGAALSLEGEFKELRVLPDGRTIRAGAGAMLASLCALARDRGLSGLEFAWGIPGSVGGAVYMDAGAYGGETRDVAVSVTHMDRLGRVETVAGEALGFSYRQSRYTGGSDVILHGDFELRPGDPAEIASKMEELMARRKEKQPYDMPSAGSVFKRPQNGYAAALIEECGLKGRSVGGAQVSPKHAGFIVNTGGASCRDVLELIGIIQRTVYEKTGIQLEREVKLIGEE